MRWFRRAKRERVLWQHLTPDERTAYERRMATIGGPDSQAAWDALPLWLRVAMCGECHWLDAVWEANPDLGREIDGRIHGVERN